MLGLLIFVFALLKLIHVPAELVQYGFYRERGNEQEWSNQPIQYAADTSRCNACHQDKYGIWQQSKHRSVSCENCHGPGEAHVEKLVKLEVDTSIEACTVCHAKNFSRPKNFPQVNVEEHAGQSNCTSCHNPHTPEIKVVPVIPHTLEGRSNCLLCHNTASIIPFLQDHEGHNQNTCLNCHRGK